MNTLTFAEELPFNHYCRKNIGYLHALKDLPSGDVLYETDDDTYLTDAAALAHTEREVTYASDSNPRWINAYRFFSDEKFGLEACRLITLFKNLRRLELRIIVP